MKRAKRALLAVVGLALAISAMVAEVGVANDTDDEAAIKRGFQIAPMPLHLKGRNHDLVGIGSYIVNAVADCNGCHSTNEYAPGGDPFKGQPEQIDTTAYLRGGQFFGPFVSRNLRPEIGTGLPAGLTYQQFLSVMRHGTDFDQLHPQISPLLQVMPWPAFRKMTDHDLQAIYQYLSALPQVPAGG